MYLVLPEENEIVVLVLTYLRCFGKGYDKVIKNGNFFTENQRNILFLLEGVAKRGGEGWGGGREGKQVSGWREGWIAYFSVKQPSDIPPSPHVKW
jgi:hypothetical protein